MAQVTYINFYQQVVAEVELPILTRDLDISHPEAWQVDHESLDLVLQLLFAQACLFYTEGKQEAGVFDLRARGWYLIVSGEGAEEGYTIPDVRPIDLRENTGEIVDAEVDEDTTFWWPEAICDRLHDAYLVDLNA